jgi:Na+/H+ antiporter NhaD/arsenite permease-like protein
VSKALADAVDGEPLLAVMALLGVSAVLSAIVDNIPYVATMSPIVGDLVTAQGGTPQAESLWWSLALGADLGGNATAVGASANVVVLGLAARNGTPISFWQFTRYGIIVATLSALLAAPYLWLRYFVLA